MVKRNTTSRQIVKSKSDILTFGKYKGETIREVIKLEPGYILWLDIKEIVEFPDDIIDEAEDESRDDPRDWDVGDMPENWGDID